MHPLVLIFLLANVHFSKPSVWVKACGFCYAINIDHPAALSISIITGTPPGYPVAALRPGDPAALALQDEHLHVLWQLTDVVDIAEG